MRHVCWLCLWIWKFPKRGQHFVVFGDTAEGLGKGDYSAGVVMEYDTAEVVAVWHGHIDPDQFGRQLVGLANPLILFKIDFGHVHRILARPGVRELVSVFRAEAAGQCQAAKGHGQEGARGQSGFSDAPRQIDRNIPRGKPVPRGPVDPLDSPSEGGQEGLFPRAPRRDGKSSCRQGLRAG